MWPSKGLRQIQFVFLLVYMWKRGLYFCLKHHKMISMNQLILSEETVFSCVLLGRLVLFPVGCVLMHLVRMGPSLALWLAIPHIPGLSEVSMHPTSASSSSPTSPAVVRLSQRGLRFGYTEKEKAKERKEKWDYGLQEHTHTLWLS